MQPIQNTQNNFTNRTNPNIALTQNRVNVTSVTPKTFVTQPPTAPAATQQINRFTAPVGAPVNDLQAAKQESLKQMMHQATHIGINPGNAPGNYGISQVVAIKTATPPAYKGVPSVFNQTGKKT
jgi:hypothetical protein